MTHINGGHQMDCNLIDYALLQYMPLYYNALVVERTSRCTARCAMCYQSAGPHGSEQIGDTTLTIDDVERLLREASTIESLAPRFHLTGGEAFIDLPGVLHLLQYARDIGFVDLTTTTNAFWAKDLARAHRIAEDLRRAGMTSMEISWDFWHQPYISSDSVSNCLVACHEAGIESNVRLLSTRSHTFEEAISLLRPEAVEVASRLTCGPVFPTGRAARELDRDDLYTQGTLDDNCHTYLNLTVNARGNVFPCCAGIDQTSEYKFGNIRETPLGEIVSAMNNSPMLRVIVFRGIRALVPAIEAAGLEVGNDYNSICHLCWSIFSSREKVAAIEQHFANLRQRAIREAISRLEQAIETNEYTS